MSTVEAIIQGEIDAAVAVLAKHGVTYKIWVAGDIEGELDAMTLPDGVDRQAVIDAVLDSREWRLLGDATDSDWDLIRQAIEEAVAR